MAKTNTSARIKQVAPLSLSRVEEGRFEKDLTAAIGEAAQRLIAHVNKYGIAETVKDKAKVSAELVLTHEGTDDGTVSIVSSLKVHGPARPKRATKAMFDVSQTGEEILSVVVRKSGSDASDPRQLKLATDDGRAIDPETHEALEPERS